MPNFTIPTNVRHNIMATAGRLADRVLHYSELNFPMTVEQIEAAVTDADTREKMMVLSARGVHQPRTDAVNILLDRSIIPNLKRGVIVGITSLPRSILVPRTGVQGSVHGWNWKRLPRDANHRDCYVISLEGYTDEQLRALGTWANDVVRNKRMCNLVREVVDSTLWEKRTKTVGHLHQWWPALCGLYDGDAYWKDRFRNPPTRNLRIYAPNDKPAWEQEAKLRAAAEHVFSMASVLPVYQHPKSAVNCSLNLIEKLEGDQYIT